MYRVAGLAGICLVLGVASAWGQNSITISDTSISPGDRFVLDVNLETESLLGGFNIILRWSSDDLFLDSARIPTEQYDRRFIFAVQPIDYQAHIVQMAILPNVTFPPPYPVIPPGRYTAERLHFTCSPSAAGQQAFVDTAILELVPGVYTRTGLTTPTGKSVDFSIRPGAITIGLPSVITMIVTPPSLFFNAVQNGPPPPAHTLRVGDSTGAAFEWTASWGRPWLDVSPIIGKTPAQPSVWVDQFSLPPGTYQDTILLQARRASNSPVGIPVTLVVDTSNVVPPDLNLNLSQSRPNPFVTYHDPETEIRFQVDTVTQVQVRIYDLLGRPVRTLFSGRVPAGEKVLLWDGRDRNGMVVASGHYFYRLITSRGTITRHMVVIK